MPVRVRLLQLFDRGDATAALVRIGAAQPTSGPELRGDCLVVRDLPALWAVPLRDVAQDLGAGAVIPDALLRREIERGDALLYGGPVERAERLAERVLGWGGAAAALADALRDAVRGIVEPPAPLELRAAPALRFDRGRTAIMGVLNVTPDSFSDGGRFLDKDAAVRHGLALAAAGADILDVGGESTRPGAAAVSESEEIARVVPVIEALVQAGAPPVSVDTTKSAVAHAALDAGAAMVNDVTGFHSDLRMAEVAAAAGAAVCLMHIQGTPRTMQAAPRYADLMGEIADWLAEGVERAVAAGVRPERICVDPGIGFGKSLEHNLHILKHLRELSALGRPILVGTSRKSFLGKLTGAPVESRLVGTLASVVAAAARGAHIVRVHDVQECAEALKIADAVQGARAAGALFGQP